MWLHRFEEFFVAQKNVKHKNLSPTLACNSKSIFPTQSDSFPLIMPRIREFHTGWAPNLFVLVIHYLQVLVAHPLNWDSQFLIVAVDGLTLGTAKQTHVGINQPNSGHYFSRWQILGRDLLEHIHHWTANTQLTWANNWTIAALVNIRFNRVVHSTSSMPSKC